MARMHARRRGSSGSVRPHRKDVPEWSNTDLAEIEKLVVGMKKEGLSSSLIGMTLRDKYGVPDIKLVTGKRLGAIFEENDLVSEIPEDLRNLMQKALGMRKHLAENKKDIHNKRQLQLTESKVRRLVRYYTKSGKLPKGWTYKPETAEILLSR
ncbi:MAG: 30S ribosomal protein S15 [Methanocalculus sp.]|uniref:30S ribosomal protein S15 n=1 Tax=Methanocalculus sp. TaxID=2004547 RepID=UPI00271AA5DC|nr:30S ribosomal protein S15 [Methanocalculus sp.]MDO8841008.1 30S ribosomal protein S15 [Methanocalculus sp.]MDO9539889.1 30S ribosomal protein S15 [Methanocalculus sp.]